MVPQMGIDMTWLDDVAHRAFTRLPEAPWEEEEAEVRAPGMPRTARADGGVAIGVQAPSMFVQALVAETLIEMDAVAHRVRIERTLARIARACGGRRHAARSPYPERPAFPPDAAELAQLLLLFVRAGRRDLIAAHCAPPLAAVLPYAEADGAIPNWLLPPPGRDPAPSHGAIADLLHALARWDARRFLGLIVAGTHWVAARQQPDGGWPTDPGTERTYASWRALRLLGAVMPNHPAVQRGVTFLLASRIPEGGWGSPLATACALLALVAARAPAASLRNGLSPLLWLPEQACSPLTAALTLRAALALRPLIATDAAPPP